MLRLKSTQVKVLRDHPTIPGLRVSLSGLIFSGDRQLTPSSLPNGYMRINLKRAGKQRTCLVHRLVAETYLPNPDGLPYVNHKDGDKSNNAWHNLEWVTPSQNAKHAWDTGLVKAYERRPEDRQRLATIAKTYPRGGRGQCIAYQ